MSSKKEVARAAGIYTAGTLLSRLLGFGREVAIAYFLGTGMAADAFFVAFRLPNLWRRLFAEGSMVVVFVPIFTEYLTTKSRREAIHLARIVWTMLGAILLGLSILGIFLAPWLVKLIAPGFARVPEKFSLTVTLTRIMFPYVFLICLTALAIAMLNALRHFTAPAFSYSLLNVSMIASLLLAHKLGWPGVYCLAGGVMIGGILQLGLQLPFLFKEGFTLRPLWNLHHPALKRILILMGPAVIGAAVYQLSIFINTILASFLPEGSVSYLYYADRLVQFPLALFAFSLGTASLPTLSEQAVKKDYQEFKHTLAFGLQTVFFLIFPATLGLIIFKESIIALLLQRGAFSSASTQATAQALYCYALGLVFFSALRLLNNAFYALQDTATPVKVSAFCLVFNLFLGILLMIPFKHAGLALTTSIVGCLNVMFLTYLLQKRIGRFFSSVFWQEIGKTTLAGLGMGLCLWLFKHHYPTNIFRQVFLGIPLGGFTFFIFASMLKCSEIITIKRLVGEKLGIKSG
ncbi:MAG: murein biosynthesis integral membrane protein MurJ [Candidatus Desulfofervidaceae bacterium]|nr:murein biosynthesis integral membrane protein MurJ [Candidatus Desulfofervidaceae bacterium]